MNKSKKALVTTFSLALAMIMLVGLTLAYLTDMRSVNNFLKFGNGGNPGDKAYVQVSLTEKAFAASATSKTFLNASTEEIKEATLENIVPGASIKKDPAIQNVGKGDIYIRVKFDLPAAQMSKLEEAGLKINGSFKKASDGYYYLTNNGTSSQVLAVGSSAVDFFQLDANRVSMKIPTSWTKDDIIAMGLTDNTLEMPIVVEAIQVDSFQNSIPWADEKGQPIVATAIVSDSDR